ncbi:tetratricopeptide repeat protein 33-like [Glandiceps talaboti]
MTSFGWKRKIGDSVQKSALSKFQTTAGVGDDSEDDEFLGTGEIDWLELARIKKKSRVLQIEDNLAKSARLKREGATLAEAERYWEAIKRWDEAIDLTPDDATIYEMKAQALMELSEVFPAVQTAEKAVCLNPRWWIAHQTLGRALLGLGEITMALRSFAKALHLNPVEQEVWQDDLMWARDLKKRNEENLIAEQTENNESEKENIDTMEDKVIHLSKQIVKAR